MASIELSPVRLSRQSYFRLLLALQWRKSGWLHALCLLLGGLLWIGYDGEPLHLFLISACLGWPVVMVVWLFAWTRRKDNQRIYEERWFVLDEQKLLGTTPGGGRSEIPWSYVQRTMEIDGHLLLFLSAGQMIILDRSAFPDAASEQRLRSWIAAAKRS
jgi:hypothetical protein